MSLTPSAMFAMERASAEARRRGVPDVAPLHLLLATVSRSDIRAWREIDFATVREEARAALDD